MCIRDSIKIGSQNNYIISLLRKSTIAVDKEAFNKRKLVWKSLIDSAIENRMVKGVCKELTLNKSKNSNFGEEIGPSLRTV